MKLVLNELQNMCVVVKAATACVCLTWQIRLVELLLVFVDEGVEGV